jgi:hypothetical protein
MAIDGGHITDQDLLQVADSRLTNRRIRAHLADCSSCSTRMAAIQEVFAELTTSGQALDAKLPAAHGSRALLRARLAELAREPGPRNWMWLPGFPAHLRAIGFAALLLAALVFGGLGLRHFLLSSSRGAFVDRSALPVRAWTPGVTRTVALTDVCSATHEEVVRPVTASLRDQVLRQYGIGEVHAREYEIDWLIAPGLGGAEDIHNLWPQPSGPETWNAGVKDALEERLHQMVCAGTLDLSTAQRDIATNWIAAYQKYFHTSAPLEEHARREHPPIPIHRNAFRSIVVLLAVRGNSAANITRH